MDDGQAGDYFVVLGQDAEDPQKQSLVTSVTVENLEQSNVHRTRYRALNSIGWGPWSEVAYLLVAEQSVQPAPPTLVFVDET